MLAKRKAATLGLVCAALLGIALVAATPVEQYETTEYTVWNGPKASPDTLALTPRVSARMPTLIDYIYVQNIAGGTATNANVAIWRYSRGYTGADTTIDSIVVWQGKAIGGPAAAPALGVFLAAPGGLYKSATKDTLKIIVTMASATSLYVACKYHEAR